MSRQRETILEKLWGIGILLFGVASVVAQLWILKGLVE